MNAEYLGTNLTGNKVSDLIAALKGLDQDAHTDIERVDVSNGKLIIHDLRQQQLAEKWEALQENLDALADLQELQYDNLIKEREKLNSSLSSIGELLDLE